MRTCTGEKLLEYSAPIWKVPLADLNVREHALMDPVPVRVSFVEDSIAKVIRVPAGGDVAHIVHVCSQKWVVRKSEVAPEEFGLFLASDGVWAPPDASVLLLSARTDLQLKRRGNVAGDATSPSTLAPATATTTSAYVPVAAAPSAALSGSLPAASTVDNTHKPLERESSATTSIGKAGGKAFAALAASNVLPTAASGTPSPPALVPTGPVTTGNNSGRCVRARVMLRSCVSLTLDMTPQTTAARPMTIIGPALRRLQRH